MKNLALTLISVVLLASCVSVEFTQPQPTAEKSLKKYPKELRGKYMVRIVSGDDEPLSDTLIIADKYYEDHSKSPISADATKKQVFLSDSCILRPYKKGYFINFKDDNERYWTSALININQDKNLMVYGLFAGENEEEDTFIEGIRAFTKVESQTGEDGTVKYNISPSKEELMRLVDDGFFKPVYELIRIKN